jgi:hypothetical protein
VRPQINVPFIVVTSKSDGESPITAVQSNATWLEDPLLIRWYGTNPTYKYTNGKHPEKFRPLHLGLSVDHPQEKYLRPYLELTNFTNPFLDKSRWIQSIKKGINFDDDVIVFFGLNNKNKPWRTSLWQTLCSNTKSTSISCGGNNSTTSISPSEVYSIASHYPYGISPPGVGWDCYRTYEYFFLGMIPIIDKAPYNEGYDVFEGLPAIHIDKLGKSNMRSNEVTRDSIASAIHDYIGSPDFQNNTFSGWRRLFLGYWRREIMKDAGREIIQDEQGNDYFVTWKYTLNNGDANFEPDEYT